MVAVRIREGHYGSTTLDGVTFAKAYWWPGAVHEGNGIVQLAIDERATPEQRDGDPEDSQRQRGLRVLRDFRVRRFEGPRSHLRPRSSSKATATSASPASRCRGSGEFRAEPIRNPVTGEEHRALINLPNGFEYKEAEMANCLEGYAKVGDKVISNTNSYAQFAAVDWSNA